MDQSGLVSFMDAKAREEWRKQLESHELPELTADNIRSSFAFIHGSRREMFDRGVVTPFKRLSWDYKTNQPFRFGKRIILNRLLSIYGSDTAHAFLNHTTTDALDDLLRVFHVFDGKPARRGGSSIIPTSTANLNPGVVVANGTTPRPIILHRRYTLYLRVVHAGLVLRLLTRLFATELVQLTYFSCWWTLMIERYFKRQGAEPVFADPRHLPRNTGGDPKADQRGDQTVGGGL
jgi:hypothetical protein